MSSVYGKRALSLCVWKDTPEATKWFPSNIELKKGKTRGMFDVAKAPHLEFPLELVSRVGVKVITMRVASQTQKTTLSLGSLMYWLDTSFHDMFYMIPRAKDLKKFLKFKIQPFIDGCKTVKDKIEEYSQDEKERKNSFFYNTPSNLLAIISSNDTKSITTKFGVFDEAAEIDIPTIEEALERFKDYGDDYKVLIVSTQINERDAINHYFKNSEAIFSYMLRCIHCDDLFIPSPEHLKIISEEEYKKEVGVEKYSIEGDYIPYASRSAYLECPCCQSKITTHDKSTVLYDKRCEWVQVRLSYDEDGNFDISTNDVIKKDVFDTVGLDANSMINPRVSIEMFAMKELKCRYADPLDRVEMYEKFYVGWWNRIYKDGQDEIIDRNDVLLITNNLNEMVVPKNTNALHLSVDLQKNRLYVQILAVKLGEENNVGIDADIIYYDELFSDFGDNDFMELRKVIDREYLDLDGNVHKISSVACDIRGFSQEDAGSRSNKMLDFIFDYALYLKEFGVIDWDKFIHPTYGVDKFSNKQHESQGFKIINFDRMVDNEKVTIKGIAFSNNRIKSISNTLINNAIENAKGEANHTTNILHITDKMVQDFEDRKDFPKRQRMDKHSIESHLTSEYLGYMPKKKEKTYIKKNNYRNDYFDCLNMNIIQVFAYRTHTGVLYEQSENTDTVDLSEYI